MRNLKKVIALVAVFALLVSTVAFAQTYSDVAENDAYAEAIETLSMLGILTGDDADGDGQMDFRPADTITRAEVAAIVCRIQNMNSAAQATTPFTDVPSTHWASGYVSQAAGQGIVNGYGDGNFGPDDNVTYEQVIKMLMETLGYNLFAADNGGYPTGYLTAAQRYGVLEGVIGGGSGTEANRGMVAQMVYNAIDTPLMDKYYYGKDATYMIYDGQTTGVSYMTLMSRDLKIVKASGTVTANSYTTLGTTGANVDLEAEKKMILTADGSDVNYWYLGVDKGDTLPFKQGDVNADALLGYAVNIYAKKNVNGTYTLLSATKDGAKNETVSFTLDLYDGLDTTGKTTFEYLKDEDASNASTATLATNAKMIINGVAVAGSVSDYFADTVTSGKIGPEGKYNSTDSYNGSVTLVDTEDATGYDLVVVELATTAVVNKVGSTGLVTFLNRVNLPVVSGGAIATSALANLSFDEEDTDYLITLTKDGEEIDFTELQKWDVLSIKNGAVGDIYEVSVLGEANYVDSYVKATRNDGKILLADGNLYEVASNGYKVSGLDAGDSGRFYIDAYGKIVAVDDKVAVEGVDAAIADNYAIVLNAKDDSGLWDDLTVVVQILDKSGAVYEAQLASNVTYKNLHVVNASLATTLNGSATGAEDFSFKTEDLTNATAAQLATALSGKMISYTANSAGAISAVTFAQTADDEEDLFQVNAAKTGTYDEDDMQIDGVDIDEDTYVFFFTNAAGTGTLTYGAGSTGAADYSRVGKGSEMVEGSYTYVAFDNADGAAKAIVVMNTTGEISPAAHVAIIDGIGQSSSNGNKVYIVDYWMNGEKLSATTAVDLTDITTSNAKKGDIFKLNVSNGTITAASKVFTMTRNANNTVTGATSVSLDSNKTGGVFGAIYDENARGNLKLRLAGADSGVIKANDAETANVYVIDPNKSDARQIYVGSLANAYVDENLTEAGNKIDIDKDDTIDVTVDGNGNADYLLDYAYAYQYEGDAIDIVIYKPYTFTYTLK